MRDLPGSTRAQEVVIRTAVGYLDNLAQEAGSDRALRLEIAQGYMKVGALAFAIDRPSLGKPEEARANYDKARALIEALRGSDRNYPRLEAAASVVDRLTGDYLHANGRASEALAVLERSLQTAESALARSPDNVALLEALHDAQNSVLSQFEASQLARVAVKTHVAVAERLTAVSPVTAANLGRLAVAHSVVGKAAAGDNRLEEALRHYRRAVELQARAFDLEPNSVSIRRNLMLAWSNIADHELGPLGPYSYTGANGPAADIDPAARARALAAYRKVQEMSFWLYERDPNNDTVKLDLAMSLGRSAPAFPGDDREAIVNLEKCLAILGEIEPTFPARTLAFVIEFRGSLAERRRLMGDLEGALAEWRVLDGIINKAIAVDPGNYYPRRLALPVYYNWALTLARKQDRAGAERYARRLEQLAAELDASEEQYARGPGWPPRVRSWLVKVYEALGDSARADAARQESLAMWKAIGTRTDLPQDVIDEARDALNGIMR
jgi:tetratricopeptide (TPR) repeat protein